MTVVEGGHPLPARRKAAVEGGVYCHDCAPDPNNNNQLILLIESSGIAAAVLKLQCHNTKKMWEEEITTDHKGELVFKKDRVTSWGAHKCQLFFVSSPQLNCSSTVFPFEETYGHPLIPVTAAPS